MDLRQILLAAKVSDLYRRFCFRFQAIRPANRVAATLALTGMLIAANTKAEPDLGNLISLLQATPEGEWAQANLNEFHEVWTPPELRPLAGPSNPPPSKIISAWASFAWDSARGDLVIYGGGHGNYAGNDVYRWRGTTQLWERASLPSEVTLDTAGQDVTVDGPDAAPVSAHTYDNNVYLPISDRFLTFGGAKWQQSGPYTRDRGDGTARPTGPYTFDLSKADPDRVGGLTGSHVTRVAPFPDIIGSEAWENRDIYGNLSVPEMRPSSFIDAATAVTEEFGRDVVYVSAPVNLSSVQYLFKYTLNDLDDATLDQWELVGVEFAVFNLQGAGAYDEALDLFVRTAGGGFTFWDVTTQGQQNRNVLFQPTSLGEEFELTGDYGFDYDITRDQYLLWAGGGEVWVMKSPGFVSSLGWTIEKQPTPILPTPSTDIDTGVLGKWKYVQQLDAFIGLVDDMQGNVWIYKPIGWQDPSHGEPNDPPTAGFNYSCINLGCDFYDGSTDSDGSVVSWSWDFGDGGSSTAQSPSHSFAADGSYPVTLTVTDDDGASDTTSQTVTVSGGGGGTDTELIVDNQDANTEKTGTWYVSSGTNPWAGQSVYNNGSSVFRWLPAIQHSGRYQVYAWWTYHNNRSSTVPYRIAHDAGVSTVTVNQHDPALGGQWVLLGEYDFAAGTGYVEVSSKNGQASADAVRLKKAQ